MVSNPHASRWCSLWFASLSVLAAAQPVFGAEFILGPADDRPSTQRDSAATMRERARAQRGDDGAAPSISTIIEELDDFQIGPRSSGANTENRNRAKSYQQGGDGSTPLDLERLLIDPDSNRGRVKSNLDRAHAYQQGRSPGVTNSRMGGTENLPLVDCGAVQSNAGRIGDDVGPGSVLTIMKGDRGVRVRCK